MPNKFWEILSVTFIISLLIIQAESQTLISQVNQIEILYKQLKFDEALVTGNNLLRNPAGLSADQLAFLHKYLGVIHYTLGRQDSARFHFLSYFNLEPDGILDPVHFSPKITSFFQEVKDEYQSLPQVPLPAVYNKYIFITDPRPAATWRSALLPGWGQFYKGQKSKGWVMGGAFFSSLIFSGFAYYNENRYHDQYLDSQDPADIKSAYDNYNTWYKIRRNGMIFTAVIWILNVADALWSPYPLPIHSGNSNSQIPGISINIH